jgi:threonine dehydratase
MKLIDLPSLDEIKAAYALLKEKNIHSPLKHLEKNIFIKLECQLPNGSYKIRGVEYFAANNDERGPIQVLSAGNLALALGERLKKDNIDCEAIVPEGISLIKREGLKKVGAQIQEKSFDEIWQLVHENTLRQSKKFLHPLNKYLLAGYATIILELQQSNFNHGMLIVPYGLGGLALSLAHAIDLLQSNIKLVICEIAGAAPFSRARMANKPVPGAKLKSFIEAMGTPCVIPDVFLFLNQHVADVIQVTEEEVKQEINLLSRSHNLRIEGAAGASLAAARKLKAPDPILSLLTGANISQEVLQMI